MKHLNDIERHARELAGREFEVTRPTEDCLWLEDDGPIASFRADGFQKLMFGSSQRDLNRLARFVSLCSELDAWIKGDAK